MRVTGRMEGEYECGAVRYRGRLVVMQVRRKRTWRGRMGCEMGASIGGRLVLDAESTLGEVVFSIVDQAESWCDGDWRRRSKSSTRITRALDGLGLQPHYLRRSPSSCAELTLLQCCDAARREWNGTACPLWPWIIWPAQR